MSEGSVMDLPGGTAQVSTKSARPAITAVTTNVIIGDSNHSFVLVQRDALNIVETDRKDQIISSGDPTKRFPPRMSEWTRDDVSNWMKNCLAIREPQAEEFAEKVTNGNLLISYNAVNLQRDVGFTKNEVDRFVESRNAWLSKDTMLSTVSETAGGASSLGHQLNVTYNIAMQNAKDCIVIIGDNQPENQDRPFVDTPVKMHVATDPVDFARQKLIYQTTYLFMQRAAQQLGIKGVQGIINAIEHEGGCSLKRIERSSIRFIVRFYSQESLAKFNGQCLNGELAKTFTAHLITDGDIRKASGKELNIRLTIRDTDYREALRILHPSKPEIDHTEEPMSSAGIPSTEAQHHSKVTIKMASNIPAESVLDEISQDHLECPICSERFKQPKLLECSHSFCLECLQQLRENRSSTTRLSCPVCRKETLLKQNGIDGLKADFKTSSLIEAIEKQEIQLKQLLEKEVVTKCSKHTDKDLTMFCNNCKKLICTTCISKDHQSHSLIEINKASDKCKQSATELAAELRQKVETYNIANQEIDESIKTLESKYFATKEKISKKANEEKQKLMHEAEQIYKDRVKTMQTARATNNIDMNKVEHKQDEVNQLMDQRIKIVHHIEQLLQDLKEYREKKSTKVPDGLTYMDFKEGQQSLGRLVLKDEQQVESATSAQSRKPTMQSMKHFKQDKWTLKTEINKYKKQRMVEICALVVAAYSNSDFVVSDMLSKSLITIPAESNPQSPFISQKLSIQGITIRFSSITVNKNDELIVLDSGTVKIFNRDYQLLHQFNPGGEPSCIAVDDNNLIAVGYYTKAKISLHKPDGSLIRTLPAPGIGVYLTTDKHRLIYTTLDDSKLVSVTYNGEMVFSVAFNQSGWPHGVCCDKDGSIYVTVWREPGSSSGEIHHYSPDGKYIGCIINDCDDPSGITFTPAGDLVVATENSVQVFQHE
ncbi:uncharacterized protein [Asterias amurensis]|uniref:uncharacterized protein n=1 Tax=Asterias amurensis TaxID=7602 RepID=UPI003AB2CFCE